MIIELVTPYSSRIQYIRYEHQHHILNKLSHSPTQQRTDRSTSRVSRLRRARRRREHATATANAAGSADADEERREFGGEGR